MNERRQDTPNGEESLPKPLLDALERSFSGPQIPAAVDERVRDEIRAHFLARERHRAWWRRGIPAAAAAAVLLLSFTTFGWWGQRAERPKESRTISAQDPDGSGRLDMADALFLARLAQAGEGDGPDIDGDGHFDEGDARALARNVVDLKRWSR